MLGRSLRKFYLEIEVLPSHQQMSLAYFPYLKKNESRLMRSPCCLCVCEAPINF
jgi:hypothetical protein